MRTHQGYCKYCGVQFVSERKSAKYCTESCKQKYKNSGQMNDMVRSMVNAGIELDKVKTVFDDNHDPDMILSILPQISYHQRQLDKMLAYIGTIETEQSNTWYQCKNCNQRTFGKVEKCDFCGKSDFRRIAV